MAFENYYAGECVSCFAHVPKRAGVYYYGHVFCSEPQSIQNPIDQIWEQVCAVYFEKRKAYFESPEVQAVIAEKQKAVEVFQEECRVERIAEIPELVAQLNMRPATLAKMIVEFAGAEVAISDLTFQQSADVWNELQKRLDKKMHGSFVDEMKVKNICPRCSGHGVLEQWKFTGGVCYRCGGSGKYQI